MSRYVHVAIDVLVDCDGEENARAQAVEFVSKLLNSKSLPENIKFWSILAKVQAKEPQGNFITRSISRLKSLRTPAVVNEVKIAELPPPPPAPPAKPEKPKTILINESQSLPLALTDAAKTKIPTYCFQIFASNGVTIYNSSVFKRYTVEKIIEAAKERLKLIQIQRNLQGSSDELFAKVMDDNYHVIWSSKDSLPTPVLTKTEPAIPPKPASTIKQLADLLKTNTYLFGIWITRENGILDNVSMESQDCRASEISVKAQNILDDFVAHAKSLGKLKIGDKCYVLITLNGKSYYSTSEERKYTVQLHTFNKKHDYSYEVTGTFKTVLTQASIWFENNSNKPKYYLTIADMEWGFVVYTCDPYKILEKTTPVLTKSVDEEPEVHGKILVKYSLTPQAYVTVFEGLQATLKLSVFKENAIKIRNKQLTDEMRKLYIEIVNAENHILWTDKDEILKDESKPTVAKKEEPKTKEGTLPTPKGYRDYCITVYAFLPDSTANKDRPSAKRFPYIFCSTIVKCNSFQIFKQTKDELKKFTSSDTRPDLKRSAYAIAKTIDNNEVRYDTRYNPGVNLEGYLIQIFKHATNKPDKQIRNELVTSGELDAIKVAKELLEEERKDPNLDCKPEKLYYLISFNGKFLDQSTGLPFEELETWSPVEFGYSPVYQPKDYRPVS